MYCINETCFKTVPRKKDRIKRNIPRDRNILMRRRAKLNNKLRCGVSDSRKANIMTELLTIDEKLVASHEAGQRRDEAIAVEKIKTDKNFFFKYAKTKSQVKVPVGPLQVNQELVSEPTKMCQIIKSQFESVFSIPVNTANIDYLLNVQGPRCIEDIDFNEEDILTNINMIAAHSAAGPDGISAK